MGKCLNQGGSKGTINGRQDSLLIFALLALGRHQINQMRIHNWVTIFRHVSTLSPFSDPHFLFTLLPKYLKFRRLNYFSSKTSPLAVYAELSGYQLSCVYDAYHANIAQ